MLDRCRVVRAEAVASAAARRDRRRNAAGLCVAAAAAAPQSIALSVVRGGGLGVDVAGVAAVSLFVPETMADIGIA